MIIRCWGARGSIPVSGEQYLRYGGDTTCMEIRPSGGEVIIIDAGSGIRALGNALTDEGLREFSFVFTHAHWDHILGFPFFKPLYTSDARLTIHGCPMQQGNMETLLSRVMSAPYFPVPFDQVRGQIHHAPPCEGDIIIGDVNVSSIPLSHPNMGLGYKFTQGSKTFAFITDNELEHPHRGGRTFDEYVEFCRGVDLLIHDAEYTQEEYAARKGWGHSSWHQAARLAASAGVSAYGLYHHNQDRSDDGVDALVEQSRELLRSLGADIDCFGVRQGQEISL